jgi:hypothetical protein
MKNQPFSGGDARASNAAMAAKILAMPTEPYREGGYVLRVAEIRGRHSGTLHQVPIAVVQLHGALYLVSPIGQRPWAQNLLTKSDCTMTAQGQREDYRAMLASATQAVPVLRCYLSQLTFVLSQFPFTGTEPDAEIMAKLDQVAVFRLEAKLETK